MNLPLLRMSEVLAINGRIEIGDHVAGKNWSQNQHDFQSTGNTQRLQVELGW